MPRLTVDPHTLVPGLYLDHASRGPALPRDVVLLVEELTTWRVPDADRDILSIPEREREAYGSVSVDDREALDELCDTALVTLDAALPEELTVECDVTLGGLFIACLRCLALESGEEYGVFPEEVERHAPTCEEG